MQIMSELTDRAALVLVDVQEGFHHPVHGHRDNPDAEVNIGRLATAWIGAHLPVVRVRHAATTSGSPLHPDSPGYAFMPVVADLLPALDVVKSVHSAFLGTPDLAGWLRSSGLRRVVIAGIQTNRCCESTARSACDLGFEVLFASDAMHTFDAGGVAAEDLAAATVATVGAYFGTVVDTQALVVAAGQVSRE